MLRIKKLIRSIDMSSALNESVVNAFENLFITDSRIGGAGAFIICPKTKKVLLGKRNPPDKFADHWCTFGGTVDENEDPFDTIPRELYEEAGIVKNNIDIHHPPIYIDETKDGFKFMTVVAIANDEFPVKLNNEHSDYGWFSMMNLPTPMHPGVNRMLANPHSIKIILEKLNG